MLFGGDKYESGPLQDPHVGPWLDVLYAGLSKLQSEAPRGIVYSLRWPKSEPELHGSWPMAALRRLWPSWRPLSTADASLLAGTAGQCREGRFLCISRVLAACLVALIGVKNSAESSSRTMQACR